MGNTPPIRVHNLQAPSCCGGIRGVDPVGDSDANRLFEAGTPAERTAHLPNQNLFRVANATTTFADAFGMADQVLCSGISCITDLMVKEGLVNLDFADVCSIMSEMGTAMIGAGEAAGDRRAHRAAEAAIANPLFDDASLKGARGVLISITGGNDLTLYEVGRSRKPDTPGSRRGSKHHRGRDHRARSRASNAGVGRRDGYRSVGESSYARSVLRRAGSRPKRWRRLRWAGPRERPSAPSSRVHRSRRPQSSRTPPLLAPVIQFPEPTGRRQTLDEETHFDPRAIRRLLDRFAVAASERRQARRASA